MKWKQTCVPSWHAFICLFSITGGFGQAGATRPLVGLFFSISLPPLPKRYLEQATFRDTPFGTEHDSEMDVEALGESQQHQARRIVEATPGGQGDEAGQIGRGKIVVGRVRALRIV